GRRDRRVGFRGVAGIRRLRILGRPPAARARRLLSSAARRARVALSCRQWRWSAAVVTDYGLDLAVVGNGRTAALVDPSSRIVWWCFPRFDSDPVFCRLLAGDEEKGFADLGLHDFAGTRSDYRRHTPIVTTTMHDRNGGGGRGPDLAPRP